MGRRNRKHGRGFAKAKRQQQKQTHTAPAKPECNCNGPGSANPKWAVHLKMCPAYVVPKGGTTVGTTTYYSKKDCKHYQDVFVLEEDLMILASAAMDRPWGYSNPQTFKPDLGFYLDKAWTDYSAMYATPGLHVPWMRTKEKNVVIYPVDDFGEPDSLRQFDQVIRWLLDHLRMGKVVETGCVGGHGRTGTVLACLLVAQGVPAWDAILRVRNTYCREAIESWRQEEFIEDLDTRLNGRTRWPNRPWAKPEPVRTTSMPPVGGYHAYADGNPYFADEQTPLDRDDDEEYNEWLRREALNGNTIHFSDGSILTGGKETTEQRAMKQIIEGDADKIARSVMDDILSDLPQRFEDSDVDHTNARTYMEAQQAARMQENDMYCGSPPCAYPGECDVSVGECWKRLTGGGATS